MYEHLKNVFLFIPLMNITHYGIPWEINAKLSCSNMKRETFPFASFFSLVSSAFTSRGEAATWCGESPNTEYWLQAQNCRIQQSRKLFLGCLTLPPPSHAKLFQLSDFCNCEILHVSTMSEFSSFFFIAEQEVKTGKQKVCVTTENLVSLSCYQQQKEFVEMFFSGKHFSRMN